MMSHALGSRSEPGPKAVVEYIMYAFTLNNATFRELLFKYQREGQ